MLHTLKNVNHTFLADFFTSLCALMINLASQLFFAGKKMQLINSLKNSWRAWLMQKSGKKYCNKSLVMSAEDEELFQLSSKCWICDKLFDVGDDKVTDHCHVTGKYIEVLLNGVVMLILNWLKKFLQHFIIQGIMGVIYSCKE